jgi:hypothetical protein
MSRENVVHEGIRKAANFRTRSKERNIMTGTTFSVGDEVEHKEYGIGVVEGISADGQKIAVEVDHGTYYMYLGYVSARGWKKRVAVAEEEVKAVPTVLQEPAKPEPIPSVEPDPLDPSLDDPIVKNVVRAFAFDIGNAAQYLWIVHRFVIGEPVRIIGNKAWFGCISNARFDDQTLIVTVKNTFDAQQLDLEVLEEQNSTLPLFPDCLRPGEEVFHPKHGCGKIIGTSLTHPLVQFTSGMIKDFRSGKKLRRIHISPAAREFPLTA